MQDNIALSDGSKRMVACPFGLCSGDQWCPHAVQVVLATDRVRNPGRDGAEIASQNVIAAWEAVAKVAEGLLMWHRTSRTPPRRGRGVRKRTDGAC